MSLPKDLSTLAKDVLIPHEWLFGDEIIVTINNINAQQKTFKVDKTYFRPERTFDRHAYFLEQNLKKIGRDLKKSPEINIRDMKTNRWNSLTRKQGSR